MQLNESTYQYIETVSSKICEITRELVDCIKRAADMASNYHYIVYYAFVNQIREKQIEAVRKIKEIYEDTRHAAEAMCIIMNGTQESEFSAELSSVLLESEDKLNELLSCCEGIPNFRPETANPRIENADDEIYESFSQYKNIIDKYPLNEPDESDDEVSNLFCFFFRESVNIYEELFCEYDRMLSEAGFELETRISADTKSKLFKLKDGLGTAKTVVSGIADIVKKISSADMVAGKTSNTMEKAFVVVEKTVGICTSLAEKYKDSFPRESVWYKVSERLENVGKTIELTDNILSTVSPDIKESAGGSAMKLILAFTLEGQDVIKVQKMKDSGILDVGINFFGLVGDVGSVFASKSVLEMIKKLPSTANNALGLCEAILKCYHDNDVHILPRPIDDFLHSQAVKIDSYNKKVEEYKQKVIQKIPVRKPKAPPWMFVHKGIQFAANCIEEWEEWRGDSG